jgi:quinolinate synthase
MAMNGLASLAAALESGIGEIHVDPVVGKRAKRAIDRMLDFAADLDLTIVNNPGASEGIGPA